MLQWEQKCHRLKNEVTPQSIQCQKQHVAELIIGEPEGYAFRVGPTEEFLNPYVMRDSYVNLDYEPKGKDWKSGSPEASIL